MKKIREPQFVAVKHGEAIVTVDAVCESCRERLLDRTSQAASIMTSLRPGCRVEQVRDTALLEKLRHHLTTVGWTGCSLHDGEQEQQQRLRGALTRIATEGMAQ